jgi:hypothetical protein
MAKGRESKSIEAQVEDSKTKNRGKHKASLTPAEMEVRRRREVLLLSRSRVSKDLQASQNQRYTDQLSRALADIEAQLSALDDIGNRAADTVAQGSCRERGLTPAALPPVSRSRRA